MKKRSIIVCLMVGMILCSACAGKESETKIGESVNSTEILETTEQEDVQVVETIVKKDVLERLSYDGETYVWNEVSIIIPAEWEGKYIIEEDEENLFVFQKASKEKDESFGLLCSIYKCNDYMNYGAGEELVAYTDDGVFYYVTEPTDVTCYVEDEDIMEEYGEMLSQVKLIEGSFMVAAENVHYDMKQYEIPGSSILALEDYHLMNMTNNELWIARNEIYARHGKIFQNPYLASYFSACSWYEPKEGKTEVSERELNEVEIANLKKIVAAEEAYAKEHPYPKQYAVGEKIDAVLHGEGQKQSIIYQVTEKENWEYDCILTIDEKTYDLNDYVYLINPIEDIFYLTDIAYYDEKLDIAVLDNGHSDDPVTYFFQYDGDLRYIGEVQGFPFDDYSNNYFDGFTGQNIVIGTATVDMIETAFVQAYYWYNSTEGMLERTERVSSDYTGYEPHELYIDIPVYYTMSEESPMYTLQAQEEVYFISTDCKEWILVRGADGVEGYIHVKDCRILNIGLPAEEVFSDLFFFG